MSYILGYNILSHVPKFRLGYHGTDKLRTLPFWARVTPIWRTDLKADTCGFYITIKMYRTDPYFNKPRHTIPLFEYQKVSVFLNLSNDMDMDEDGYQPQARRTSLVNPTLEASLMAFAVEITSQKLW
jgi:hypothetical protein